MSLVWQKLDGKTLVKRSQTKVIRSYTVYRKNTTNKHLLSLKKRTDVSYFKLRSSIEKDDFIKNGVTSCEYHYN